MFAKVRFIVVSTIFAAVFLGILILMGVGQPPKPEPMVRTGQFSDCIVETSPGRYAGIRFERGPIPASQATAEAKATPTPSPRREGSEPSCQAVPEK